MWIVQLALRRPYTFIVGALLVVIFGVLSLFRMPTDIFPEIDIPVVTVIWTYNGIPPEEMERRFATPFERGVTTTVNDVEHIESQSLSGIAVIKIFFQRGAEIESAVAQLSAVSNSILRIMPPGATPPFIIRYNAANVPVLQLALGGEGLSEQELSDLGTNGIRTRLATVRGASVPSPYGGRSRVINVDLDPEQLMARGLSPTDVSDAITAQNLVLPSGTAKIGEREYMVRLNGSPDVVDAMNDLPIRVVNGSLVRIRDVAHVRDGYAVQTNIVHRDGVRGALITVLKSGGASTIDVVNRVRAALPGILATLPPALQVDVLADQSLFVKAALNGVLVEALIAAILTGSMILLFLGSWRSTLIVVLSIPLSILCSIIALGALGQTINVMTLGGLALAVGVLVDDATVGIENIHRVLEHDGTGDIEHAILKGAGQIAIPTLVSTMAICIVFVPIFFLSGAAGSLFAPLAMAVVFAMMASYVISRTLVPTLVRYALEREGRIASMAATETHVRHGPFARFHLRFEAWFERARLRYRDALGRILIGPGRLLTGFVALVIVSAALVPWLGQDFFPAVDAGQIRLHLRAPIGTRVEETARLVAAVEGTIRRVIPPHELATILDNVGLSSSSSTNLAFSDNPTTGVTDADVLIVLSPERTGSVDEYRRVLRRTLRAEYPQVTIFFQAADIVGQILNFGLPAPINVQVVGPNRAQNIGIAQFLERRLRQIPGAVDVYLQQRLAAPTLFVEVDRARASAMSLTEREVGSDLLVSLASTATAAPSVWLNPQNGVQYAVSVQTPQFRVASLEAIGQTPILGSAAAGGSPQRLDNLAQISRRVSPAVVSHYDVAPVFDVFANVQDRDLGAVARDADFVLDSLRPTLPRGTTLVMRGQVASMRSSYSGLAFGLAFAILLVYLVMVINFQSWLDPFIISFALPGALAGIVWALFATGSTISVPAFMGAIMSMGVATANSILIVSFANDRMDAGHSAIDAALEAASTRLRPVVMTALAMIVGMLPMALGVGEGGEQNAPLGRAVIGGLTFATVATLFVVPIVYSRLRTRVVPTAAVRNDSLTMAAA